MSYVVITIDTVLHHIYVITIEGKSLVQFSGLCGCCTSVDCFVAELRALQRLVAELLVYDLVCVLCQCCNAIT